MFADVGGSPGEETWKGEMKEIHYVAISVSQRGSSDLSTDILPLGLASWNTRGELYRVVELFKVFLYVLINRE